MSLWIDVNCVKSYMIKKKTLAPQKKNATDASMFPSSMPWCMVGCYSNLFRFTQPWNPSNQDIARCIRYRWWLTPLHSHFYAEQCLLANSKFAVVGGSRMSLECEQLIHTNFWDQTYPIAPIQPSSYSDMVAVQFQVIVKSCKSL